MKHRGREVKAPAQLEAIRAKFGFVPADGEQKKTNAKKWSKGALAGTAVVSSIPQAKTFPRNAPLLNYLVEKFSGIGFAWHVATIFDRKHKARAQVMFTNYPTIGGYAPTLSDLAIVDVDMVDASGERVKKKRKPRSPRYSHADRTHTVFGQ